MLIISLLLSSIFTNKSVASVDPKFFTTGINEGTSYTLNTTFISVEQEDIGSHFTFDGGVNPLVIKEGDQWNFRIISNTVNQIGYKITFQRQNQNDLSPDQITVSKDTVEWIGSNQLPNPFQTNNITLLQDEYGELPSTQLTIRETNFTLSNTIREDTYDIETGIWVQSKLYGGMILDLVEVDLFKYVCTKTMQCGFGSEFNGEECDCVKSDNAFNNILRILTKLFGVFIIIAFGIFIIAIIRFNQTGH